MTRPLPTNGLLMPPEFPGVAYERVHTKAQTRAMSHPIPYDHFSGAWNALSIRYLALLEEGKNFTDMITAKGATSADDRYRQEKSLFAFFGNGFSTFEACFYGIYALGAMIQGAHFPLATARDQQLVSPVSTQRIYTQVFPGDPILVTFQSLFAHAAYREWKEVRNVLTHRTAPGRTLFVSFDSDADLPPIWKLNNISLDSDTAPSRRTQLSGLLTMLLDSVALFAEARLI